MSTNYFFIIIIIIVVVVVVAAAAAAAVVVVVIVIDRKKDVSTASVHYLRQVQVDTVQMMSREKLRNMLTK